MIIGQCASCGANNRVLYRSTAYGAEGCFCAKCRGNRLDVDFEDLKLERELIQEMALVGPLSNETLAHLKGITKALEEIARDLTTN